MLSLCESTKWTHLPVAGGWYDQRPEFVDAVYMYFSIKGHWEAEEEKKRQREQEAERRKGASSRASRPRR